MKAFPLFAVATLCLTLLPLAPSAAAAPAPVNSCKTQSTETTIPPGCSFVCLQGDRITVTATTTGPGAQWPRIHARCGGVDVYCQSSGSCTRTSYDRAGTNDVGTCYAETGYVDGACTASGSANDDPTWVVGTVTHAVDTYGPWAVGLVTGAPGWVPGYALGAAGMGVDIALETAANGPNAPTSCTTVALTTCNFACLPGDVLAIHVEGWMYPAWDVYGSTECGGASASCASSWYDQECSATSGRVQSAAVGTCSVPDYARATCTAMRSDLAGGAGGLVAAAMGVVGSAYGTVSEQNVHADAGKMCRFYYSPGNEYPSCTFVCVPGDAIAVQASAQARSGVFDYAGIAAQCGGASASCAEASNGCWSIGGSTAGSLATGTCYATRAYTSGACTAAPPSTLPYVQEASLAPWFVEYGIPGVLGAPAGVLAGLGGDPVGYAVGRATGTVGTVNGLVAPYAAYAQNPDGDGASTADEVLAHSDPAAYGSRPDSDDDGDGVANEDERSRAHAMTTMVANALVRTSDADRATFHFGHAGARATLRSPEGHLMTIVYAPAGVGSGCPPAVAVVVPDVSPCTVPAVASFALDGAFLGARRAYEPTVPVPASSFVVLCAPRLDGLGTCLEGVGADGTWNVLPATQSPRAATQPKLHGGFELSVQGKTFNDVAADSGDINNGGNAQNTRDPIMGVRSWNWHAQAPGSTYYACSGGLVAPCPTESGSEENVLAVRQYV